MPPDGSHLELPADRTRVLQQAGMVARSSGAQFEAEEETMRSHSLMGSLKGWIMIGLAAAMPVVGCTAESGPASTVTKAYDLRMAGDLDEAKALLE